ncbi:MAG: hypothetical protein FWC01_03935 [Treponema sp.]|nr:hypothetical protein [Treponema sp.]MCL2237140.1 hypothetical protein [Treponema sp.]
MTKTHNRKHFVLIGIIIFIILILIIFTYIMMPRGKPVTFKKDDALYETVKDGDIICRLGDRFWSQVFSDFSVEDKRFSHTGIIRIENGQIAVIHAEGTTSSGRDFVKKVPLDDFLKVARAVGIYRIMDLEENKISDAAMEYLGLPFDWKFDMTDASELYCTELLYIILKQLTPAFEFNTTYIKEMGRDIITVDAISNSEFFSEIYYKK